MDVLLRLLKDMEPEPINRFLTGRSVEAEVDDDLLLSLEEAMARSLGFELIAGAADTTLLPSNPSCCGLLPRVFGFGFDEKVEGGP